jgi:sulfate adenylyltransferase subunit 1
MDLIRIATAGSVDDGKSTLIGRLLYDTHSLKKDQLEYIETLSEERGFQHLDLSLATDGLVTEREQGITVDVSHIFLTTSKRRFILADSPGHEEYTRNMVTGSSTADGMLVLLDATKGVSPQTKRHLFIAKLLGVPHVLICINKMDAVGYDESIYLNICKSVTQLIDFIGAQFLSLKYIPISALEGENIVSRTKEMPWYNEPPLMDILEALPSVTTVDQEAFFQVQYVQINEQKDIQGSRRTLLGKVKSGKIYKGQAVGVFPGERKSTISHISTLGTSVNELHEGESGEIVLSDEIAINRGSYLLEPKPTYLAKDKVKATICWMDQRPLSSQIKYILQHGSKRVFARITSEGLVFDMHQLSWGPADAIHLNDMAQIEIQLSESIYLKPYKVNAKAGSFILIDPRDFNTVAVGFVED